MSESTDGIEAWKEHTSAFDRVQSIARSVSEPKPVSYIAEEAHVAENTARDHLERLVELNVLLESESGGTALYSPDPLHVRLQTLRELLENNDRDSLIELKADLQAEIEDLGEKYDVNSPDSLRDLAAESESAAETSEIRKAASDWELMLYRLSIVENAIENYGDYNRHYRASA
ncbi:ArsR family transcriptional regulator [Halorubrum pallidum]|uniref:ArsR family transcriptional regulator n=1 Tax=Halorubrum pallidum TaxID=1526114 RepID=A0ABD5T1F3_9EURY